ncbi:MAG: hypothetical protein U0Z75_03315 [Deinococcaceae bacterium]
MLGRFKILALVLSSSIVACGSDQLQVFSTQSFSGFRGVTSGYDYAYTMAVSASGKQLYVGGASDGFSALKPDSLDAVVWTVGASTGKLDIPQPLFLKSGAEPNNEFDAVKNLVTSAVSEDLFIAGTTESSIFFDPKPRSVQYAAFLARIDPSGRTLWSRQLNESVTRDVRVGDYTVQKILTNVEGGEEYLYVLFSAHVNDIKSKTSWIQKYNARTGAIVFTYTPWVDATRYTIFPECREHPLNIPTCDLSVQDFAVTSSGKLLLALLNPSGGLSVFAYQSSGLFDFSDNISNNPLIKDARISISHSGANNVDQFNVLYGEDFPGTSVLEEFSIQPKNLNMICHVNVANLTDVEGSDFRELSADNNGNVYISGKIHNMLIVDWRNQYSPVLAKYRHCSKNWSQRLDMIKDTNVGTQSLALDSLGNVFLSGFAPESDSIYGTPLGKNDFWVRKFDSVTGARIW